jgi:hypothetical protein
MAQQHPRDNPEDADQLSPGLAENDLPLPDPYPDYIVCPSCGEPEVEIWCYEASARCHACGAVISHHPPACFGSKHCKDAMHSRS